jgi:hypothetical protein
MFQVTVLSEPNSTVPEFVPEQTTLSNVPQKNNDNCTKTQHDHCAHLLNDLAKNNPFFTARGYLTEVEQVLDKHRQ